MEYEQKAVSLAALIKERTGVELNAVAVKLIARTLETACDEAAGQARDALAGEREEEKVEALDTLHGV